MESAMDLTSRCRAHPQAGPAHPCTAVRVDSLRRSDLPPDIIWDDETRREGAVP